MHDDELIGGMAAGHRSAQGAVSVGDDLYGLSVSELQERLDVLKVEITRSEAALIKKRAELSEAETLFGGNSNGKG